MTEPDIPPTHLTATRPVPIGLQVPDGTVVACVPDGHLYRIELAPPEASQSADDDDLHRLIKEFHRP